MLTPEEPNDRDVSALQADFTRRLFAPDEPPPACLRELDGARLPVRRFDVHRNNVMASLTGVVRARFPVIVRLLGEEFFKGMARSFVERHPPRVPVLSQYGGELPGFLETFEPVSDLPYLGEVARLEWLRHVAYHAEDRVPLGPGELGRIPPDAVGETQFELHPALGLVASDYPVFSIWETNTLDAEVKRIGRDLPGEEVLVLRPRLDVLTLRLVPGRHAFITALADGEALRVAALRALEAAPAFDLQRALASLIEAGAIVGYRLPGDGDASEIGDA